MRETRIILILLCALYSCWAKPDGAPRSACSSLTPSHNGIRAQTSIPPYTVSAVENGNNKIRVSISSPIGEDFEGFVIQARSSKDRSRMVDGTFTRNQVVKTIDCFNGKQNTLTHVNANAKTEIVTEWTPSSNVNEDIVFRATVAKTYVLFWTQVDSSPVRIESNRGSPTDRSQAEKKMDLNSNPMLDGCFSTKACFAYPAGCINRGDCEVLLSFAKVYNGIQFKLHGYLEPRVYMAMALSTDGIMGDDSVTECFREGSVVSSRMSYNEGKSNTRTQALARDRYDGSFNNGLTTCSWTSPFLTQANGKTYNLENDTYYVLLATGPMTNGRLQYHSGRIASSDSINFGAIEAIEEAGVSDSVKIHGETDESTSLQYSPTVFYTDTSTEAKSTRYPTTAASEKTVDTHDRKTTNSNDSLQLNFNHVFLLALLEFMFYASGGYFIGNPM